MERLRFWTCRCRFICLSFNEKKQAVLQPLKRSIYKELYMYKKMSAALIVAAVLCGSASFAEDSMNSALSEADEATTQNASVSFTNEIGSDVVAVGKSKTMFAGMYDETIVDVTSEKVDAGIDAKLVLGCDDDGKPVSFSWNKEDFDWYVTFRPVEMIALGFSRTVWADGSYLAVEDDNISAGDMAGDGFSLAFTGVNHLTLIASAPFGFDSDGGQNWFNKTTVDEGGAEVTERFNIGFGAEYTILNKATISVVAHNLANEDARGFGVYGSFTGVEGLGLYAGYATRDDDGICDVGGTNVYNASVSFEKGPFSCAADHVTTADHFYAGASAGYGINDTLAVSLTGTMNASYQSVPDGSVTFEPAVTYTAGNVGEICAKVDVVFVAGEFDSVCFPLYWKYSF